MNTRKCRGCNIPLSTANARTYEGRWVGACRRCESVESAARATRARSRAL